MPTFYAVGAVTDSKHLRRVISLRGTNTLRMVQVEARVLGVSTFNDTHELLPKTIRNSLTAAQVPAFVTNKDCQIESEFLRWIGRELWEDQISRHISTLVLLSDGRYSLEQCPGPPRILWLSHSSSGPSLLLWVGPRSYSRKQVRKLLISVLPFLDNANF